MKTAEERGHPASQWIVDARAALDLKDVDVAERIGYDPATLRKAEAHSDHLSRPMWRKLVPLYVGLANERGVNLRPPPDYGNRTPPESDLAAAVREQAAAIRDLVDELRAARLAPQPDLAEVVSKAVEATIRASGAP